MWASLKSGADMDPAWIFAGVGFVLSGAGIRYAIRHRASPWTLRGVGWVVGADAILVLLASVSIVALDGVLARTHLPGIADRGLQSVTGLASLTHVLGPASWYLDLPQRWYGWQTGAGPLIFARPAQTLATYLALDSLVFVPAYSFLLVSAAARSIEKSGRVFTAPAPPPRWWERTLLGEPVDESANKRLTGLELTMFGLVAASVVADLLENVFVTRYIQIPLAQHQNEGFSTAVLRILVTTKWVGVVAVVVFGIIPSAAIVLDRARKEHRLPGAVIWRLRALVVVVALFGILVTQKNLQAPDAIRRWNPAQGALTVLVILSLGLVLAWSAWRLLGVKRDSERPTTRTMVMGLGVLVGVGVVVAIFGHFPTGLLVPALALGLLLLFGWKLDRTEVGRTAVEAKRTHAGEAPESETSLERLNERNGAKVLPALLGIAPPLFLAVGSSRAMVPQTVFNHPTGYRLQISVILLATVLPSVALVAAYWAIERWVVNIARTHEVRSLTRGIAIGGAVYVWWRVIAAPWSFPQAVGTVVIVALFLTFVALFVAWLTRLQIHREPPLALSVFGFRQMPLLSFLLVWVLLVIPVARSDFHDVRLTEVPHAVAQVQPTLAVERWFARNATDDGRMHPMVFVTANGGGIKAAVWAAMVLDCALGNGAAIQREDVRLFCQQFNPSDDDRWSHSVFVASGVSGGTLGLVTFDRLRLRDPTTWLRGVLGDDFVAPSLAWQTFVEAPQTYLQFESGAAMDRAEVLERAWERATLERSAGQQLWAAAWAGDDDYVDMLSQPFLSAGGADPQPPYLVFNGLSVEDGCRLEVSNIRFTVPGSTNCTGITQLDRAASPDETAVATHDVFPFLCDPATGAAEDVRASTAVTLAARFPVVSPSGRLVACGSEGIHLHVVDGGYGDNSGGAAVAALWSRISPTVADQIRSVDPCVVPVLLEIDSGYGPTPTSKKSDVPELTVPLTGSGSARAVRTIEGRDAAALPFRQASGSSSTSIDQAIVYLRTNPEGEAPLGWTLDDSTFDQMEAQLQSNADELQTVADWFRLPCSSGGG
jgi:hypothetical protein